MSEDLDFWRFPGVWLGNGDRALGWVGLGAVDFLGGGVVFGIGAMVVFFSSHISHYAITRAGSKWPTQIIYLEKSLKLSFLRIVITSHAKPYQTKDRLFLLVATEKL